MAVLAQLRASNAQLIEATTPRTAVFVGATDGIGKRALIELVSTGFPVKAYVIGRQKARDQPLLEEIRVINKNAELLYLEGQVSLMSEVTRLTDEILGKEEKIDLYHSAGFLPFQGRQVATELLKKSWGDKWDPTAPPTAAPSAGNFSKFTPEEAGQKVLYLMASAEYGGNGADVPKGRSAALTLTHQTSGSLFSVNDKMENLQQDMLLSGLEAKGAPEAIWDHSIKTLAPWL
ncbi:uncharacterized protein VDAG_02381 [Verticillium dahliae VdLs.17]|uniref:Ketoreductase (KR) domain-containing protein n=1 Tax=Verticillium dahliae (strain VdLs.17 / ATCC MYA-4575 / FGSC 10137) TaxID=498257 RepID=G2WXP9_VERDV|nr:uncharacterized protein VDAG_02381 [Verticillium dahliae VdLs.17]EGY20857.1 hypothetical protein VDAG_02381 [Verticillium dahliae VdLs.17]